MPKILRDLLPSILTGPTTRKTINSAVRVAALAATFVSLTSCGVGRRSPSEPVFSCDDVSGTYDATFSNSCGGSGSGPVVIAQVGCSFSGLIPGFGGGTIAGQINGRSASFTLFFSAPCSGSATGTATVGRNAISGTFAGGATGFGCCNPVSGSFVMRR
ncbi:MAG TPA: hypothetical protein VKS23_00825 [Thermoanaerobaculia bacterium]|nr:hypothetical protein [Thermoanaerobaculia bacterium]